jgi:hypothetical protein
MEEQSDYLPDRHGQSFVVDINDKYRQQRQRCLLIASNRHDEASPVDLEVVQTWLEYSVPLTIRFEEPRSTYFVCTKK